MRKPAKCKAVLLCLLAGMASALAWGQTGAGVVQGVVRDTSMAVVINAEVALTNPDTGVTLRTTVNRTGVYMFPAVPPGEYRLSVEAPSMKKFEGSLTLQAQQTAVVDPVLEVGQTATTVTVTDVTPLVTADAPKLGTVVDRVRLEQLPRSSTNPAELVLAVPGLQAAFYGRAYGMLTGATETLVDGASTVDRTWGDWQTTVRTEAIQEVAIETNSSAARFSRPVNMVISTKSGTNSFRGSVYETHQNSAFGTARRREEFWTKAPQQIVNMFGASAGGPVRLPGIYSGRDRTFWFVSHEQERWVSPRTRGYSVPTEAMRRGDFSSLADAQGRRINLYDPWSTNTVTWSRQPFSHGGRLNVIDPARLSPVAMYLFEYAPRPNVAGVNPLVDYNLWLQVPINSVRQSTTGRLDHQISSKDRLFVR